MEGLMVCENIPGTGKAISSFVTGNIVFQGVELLVAELEAGIIDPLVGWIDIQRQAPVPGEFRRPQPFQRSKILLHVFISQPGGQLQAFGSRAQWLYVLELE